MEDMTKEQLEISKKILVNVITDECFCKTVISNREIIEIFRSKIYTILDIMDNDPVAMDLLMTNYSDVSDEKIKIDSDVLKRIKELKIKFTKKSKIKIDD